MLGFNKKIYERQLKRVVIINNAVMMGIFSNQVNLLNLPIGERPSESESAIIAGAINYIFGMDIGEQAEGLKDKNLVYLKASEILKSDTELERLILRGLYDIATLCHTLEKEEWATELLSEYPGIMQLLKDGEERYPELFKDYKEREYRVLVEKFADKYEPNMKNSLLGLF